MTGDFVSRGFQGSRRAPQDLRHRLPPGQYNEAGFPVLSAGPTPRIGADEWSVQVDGSVAQPMEWSAAEFRSLPQEDIVCDIHCVTRWSKFDAAFRGVALDTLLDQVQPFGDYVTAWSHGGYTTNLAIEDLADGRAWVVTDYDGEPLSQDHGGPVRLLVPHLYFWKSAKWLAGLRITDTDEPGFWEVNGYHNHGDPWKEQRYWND